MINSKYLIYGRQNHSNIINSVVKLSKRVGSWPLNEDLDFSPKHWGLPGAVLLCNFALGLGVTCWLYVCRGRPAGSPSEDHCLFHNETVIALLSAERLVLCFAAPYSTVWITLKRQHYKSMVEDIQKIESTLGRSVHWQARLNISAVLFLVVSIVTKSVYNGFSQQINYGIYTHLGSFVVATVLILTFVDHFLSFQSLIKTLTANIMLSVEDHLSFAVCYESIVNLSNKAGESYGPFVFIFIASMFVRILCNVYSQLTQDHMSWLDFNLWLAMAVLPLLHILLATSTTMHQVRFIVY